MSLPPPDRRRPPPDWHPLASGAPTWWIRAFRKYIGWCLRGRGQDEPAGRERSGDGAGDWGRRGRRGSDGGGGGAGLHRARGAGGGGHVGAVRPDATTTNGAGGSG